MQGRSHTQTRTHRARNIAIIVIAVIVAATLGVISLALGPSEVLEKYPKVAVTGRVETVEVGATPNRLDFVAVSVNPSPCCPSLGQTFSAPVEKGVYSTSLPNRTTYKVVVVWSAADGTTSGTSSGGTLDLNIDADTHTYNIIG